MKKIPIYIFIISLFLGGIISGFAQSSDAEQQADSLVYKERYGIRVGLDLSKPVRSFIDKNYSGFEVHGDFRITNKLFPAVEIGFEEFDFEENYFSTNSKGAYTKIGVNYNAYSNWIGMQNEIYAGLRYGFATYSETLYDYTVYDKDHYFEEDYRVVNQKFNNLNTHWLELQIGIKAEILHNLYLGAHVEVKRILFGKNPDNFDNLWIPGYNRKYQDSPFGVGWGYSLSYLIPIIKKDKVEKMK